MEPRIVPHEICIYVLYVCYNSENKQQQLVTLGDVAFFLTFLDLFWKQSQLIISL